MSLNFQSQNSFINRLPPVGSLAQVRFNGSQEAVSDIEYLVGKHCCGLDLGTGTSIIDAVLLPINSFRERHYLLPLHAHELLSNYESPLFSDVARRNGLNMTDNRPGAMDQSVPPLRHIPYLLDSFYSNPPTQPRYRLGVATRCWNSENNISSNTADMTVDYVTGDDTDEDAYHTIWIINDNGKGIHGGVDTWSALVCPDGNDVQTLLLNRNCRRGPSYGNVGFTSSSSQQSAIHTQEHNSSSVLSPYATKQTDLSHAIQPTWPEPSINIRGGHNEPPAAPERIPGAPAFETSLPLHELADCNMEEMLSYYPEHVLHWPGLAVLYNHYRFRLSNPIFEDTTRYLRNVRGDHVDVSRRSFRRASKRSGSQLLSGYEPGDFDGHMLPLSEAVQSSGQSLAAFLESILWTPPKDIILQPCVPLSEVGSTVLNHPTGQFSSRVLVAMQNQTLPRPANDHSATSHPMIERCLHNSPEVNETMSERISLDYYPVHLPEEYIIRHYYTQLTHEPLLYVLIKYSGNAIAHMVPEEVCPDQTHAGFKTFAAKLRKRQQVALGQRGERRKVLWKGMTKTIYHEAYGKLKKEYQEERISGGYGGVRVSAKRKDYEEEVEGTDEESRTAPIRKRKRTKKGKHSGNQGSQTTNTYTATPGLPIYPGTHHLMTSFGSTMATPTVQRYPAPWSPSISQQEWGFHAPTSFQHDLPITTFPAATFNTTFEPVYDQSSFQEYNQLFDSSGQQPPFQGSNYNTFDFDASDDLQYLSPIDPLGRIKIEEVDSSFNTRPDFYLQDPHPFRLSIDDNGMRTEESGVDDVALPELTPEDWDQMINFENDTTLPIFNNLIHQENTSVLNEDTPVLLDPPAPSSSFSFSFSNPESAMTLTTIPPLSLEHGDLCNGVEMPVINGNGQTDLSTIHGKPMGGRWSSLHASNERIDTDTLTPSDFIEKAALETINNFYPPNLDINATTNPDTGISEQSNHGTGDTTGPEIDKAGSHDMGMGMGDVDADVDVDIKGGRLGEWINAVQDPNSTDSTPVLEAAVLRVDILGRGEENGRGGSCGSDDDSLAGLFGE